MKEILASSLKVWDELNEIEQSNLIKYSKIINYKKGEIIHNGNLNCLGLIIINKGSLRAFLSSENGKQITLYKLYNNDICLFSASCIMKNINFEISLEAIEDTEILLIKTNEYKLILENSIVLKNYINQILESRFSDMMWIFEQFVFHSLDKRLATFLLEQEYIANSISITHEKIANEIGSAREVISRMLKYFENEEIIKLSRNKITIINFDKLNNISEK